MVGYLESHISEVRLVHDFITVVVTEMSNNW